jgi:hypothetical protein
MQAKNLHLYIAGDILAMTAGLSTMKSESPQSLFTAYDTEVKYVFTEAAYESPLTASHAGPLHAKSAC